MKEQDLHQITLRKKVNANLSCLLNLRSCNCLFPDNINNNETNHSNVMTAQNQLLIL